MPSTLLTRETRLQNSGTFVWAANTRQDLEFSVPDRMVKRFWLELAATITISGVSVPGSVHRDGIVNLIQKIEMTLDGKPFKLGSGAAFFRLAQKYDATDGVNAGLFSGAAGTYKCHAIVPIICEMAGAHKKTDSVLDGRRYKKIQLHITWGDGTSLVINNTSTVTVTSAKVDVYTDDVDPFTLQHGQVIRETETPFVIAATASQFYMPVPYERGSVVRAIQLRTIDGSDISDAVLNAITLKLNGGRSVPLNSLSAGLIKGRAKHEFGDSHPPAEGYFHLEFPDNGRVLKTGLGADIPAGQITGVEFYADETLGAGATSIIGHVVSSIPVENL